MATKLVVTLEGLVLSNLKEIVSSRSIDEVILVGSPSNFNKLTDFLL